VVDRGFLVQWDYRVEAGRPVVRLFGRLEGGATFLVRDTRERPRFWVPASARDQLSGLGRARVRSAERRALDGGEALEVEVDLPAEVPPLRHRLSARGVPVWEADVPFATRYLIDRGVRGGVAIGGGWSSGDGVDRVYEDPEVAPSDAAAELAVLSLDIETDPVARRLLSVALSGCGAREVLLLSGPGAPLPALAVACEDEADLLRRLVARVRELDPDVLTGWNVVDFDLRVLDRIAVRSRVPLRLGRSEEPLRLRPSRSPRRALEALVPGRAVLDGIDMLRGAFVRFEDLSLDAVAREVLGEGKTLGGPHRAEAILEAFEADPEGFVEYNLKDADLVLGILDRLGLLDLAVERSRLTGMPLERVAASVASFDFLYLSELGRRGRIASIGPRQARDGAFDYGGHVLEPVVGLHRNVLAFDFRSLYPSLIRTFQIDPTGYRPRPEAGEDLIVAPNGAAFRREPGILPGLLDRLMPRRAEALARGDAIAAHAIKILMNSFYGVLGTPTSRFFEPAVAGAITGFGREVLLWSKAWLEARGRAVLYGDTDSLFATSDEEQPEAAERLGARLAAELNEALAAHLRERWRVESRLELRFEGLFRRLLFPAVRGGAAGARKRYAGLVGDDELVFRGMETVRSDWTPLARELQRELYARLFHDRPVADWLRERVAALRDGLLDSKLVYRKRLRKPAGDYTATTPPHVAAARKLGREGRGRIEYVMTSAGPEPRARQQHPLDYEHYVQKQVRPVAEPVLRLLELDFDRVVGDDVQLSLF